MPPVLAVFDIDGTLTNSIPQHQSAFETALRRFDFPDLNTDWASYRHHTDSAIFTEARDAAGRAPDQADLKLLETRYAVAFDAVVMNWPMSEVPGASALLRALRRIKAPFVFATGSLRHGARRKLSVLADTWDDVPLVTASEHMTRESLVRAAVDAGKAQFGLNGSTRVISIGDGIWDLRTARALGLEFLGVGTGTSATRLREEGAEVLSDFTDARAALAFFGDGPGL